MKFANDVLDLELIAKAIQNISSETSYKGLAEALLREALSYCGIGRGAVLLSEMGKLLAKADADFPHDEAWIFVSQPPPRRCRLSAEIKERVIHLQEAVVKYVSADDAAFVEPTENSPYITQLFLPLIRQGLTIGGLYLESGQDKGIFTDKCISVLSIFASQVAVSFEAARLFEALRETNMWMVEGQEIGRMGSYRYNPRTQLSRGSRECYRILDLDPALNPLPWRAFQDCVHPDDLPGVEQALANTINTASTYRFEYRVIHKDGSVHHVVAVGKFDRGPNGEMELNGIIADVTARKASERALADARNELTTVSRLASMGELAGSIIHEINQPLTRIVMSAEACLGWLERTPARQDDARKAMLRVIEQVYQASDVISGLRSLVRDAQLKFADIDINDAIEEVLELLKREFEIGNVALQTRFDRSLRNIRADRTQIQQVVLNLVRNAIEAMLDVNGRSRVLTISTTAEEDHALVRIIDTGTGVNPSMKNNLFAALNTTKEAGLGLGLSICYKIISAHSGRLWLAESTDSGATFAFTVPF
ncbi:MULTISPECIES: ATP-binding protein [Bradyrhizobium]|uniref:ATP-binding protein n=1 Tax=Bradyrhizobium elkanii TaxID=29448 RepID=UPI000424B8C6|nr:ATP-binding protein [Bradyrhizobium elkanii]